MIYNPKRGQFALIANRYAWDETEQKQRRRTAAAFRPGAGGEVADIAKDEKDAVLSLRCLTFTRRTRPRARCC